MIVQTWQSMCGYFYRLELVCQSLQRLNVRKRLYWQLEALPLLSKCTAFTQLKWHTWMVVLEGELICKADLAVLCCYVHREGKGLHHRTASICQQKSGLMKYSTYGWRTGRGVWLTGCMSGNSPWQPPPTPPAPRLHGYQCMRKSTRSVLSPAPSHQIRVAAWGLGTVCVRVPWGNDTECKCTGNASDGPAHVEVFALQRRAVSTACSGSQCQGDRWRWRLLSSAPQNIRTLVIAELALTGPSTSTQLTFPHVWILPVNL